MNNQDPIADMLTRIRNANRVGRRLVLIRNSKICKGIAQVLKDEGYIDEYDVIEDDTHQGQIRVRLKYSSRAVAQGAQRHGHRGGEHEQGRDER